MKVAVVGSRDTGGLTVEAVLAQIPPETTELVSGGASGVDTLAEEAARRLGLPIRVFRPDYKYGGRLAPLARNRQIVEYADLVLAFWDHRSRGTAHTLNYCVETGKPFRIFELAAIQLPF